MKNIAITKYPVVAAESMILVSKKSEPGAVFTALEIYTIPVTFFSRYTLKKQ